MKIEQDKRRFDFHAIGKEKRKASGLTQEQLAYIVPRTIMYNENAGQHPSLNTFYQMVTMFDISVDQCFYPSKNSGSECRKRRKCNEHRPPFFRALSGDCTFRQAGLLSIQTPFLRCKMLVGLSPIPFILHRSDAGCAFFQNASIYIW